MANTEDLGEWHRHTIFTLMLLSSSLVLGCLPTTTARNVLKPSRDVTSSKETNQDYSICTSSSCKKTAERMIKSLDEKQDPCDDFYEFSCGGLTVANSSQTSVDKAIIDAGIFLMNILESNTSNSSGAVTKTRRYYYSCLGERDKKEAIPKILLEVVREIGGWHIFPNTMVKKQNFNLQRLILQVNNKCHENPLLFNWDKGLEDFNLYVKKNGIYIKNDTIVAERLIKICGMMGANESQARDQFIQVIKLRKELSEITAQSDDEEEDWFDDFTLQEWQDAAPFLNWSEFFNGVFSSPNFTILYNDSIFVDDPKYFYRLGEVITKYNKTEEGQKTLVSFMMWHLTLTLFDYLNDSNAENIVPSRGACLVETIDKFRGPLMALYARQVFTDPIQTKSQVEIIAKNIRRAYKKIFKKADWMDTATQQAALERIDSIHESIGYPNYILKTEILDQDLEELVVDPVRYYHNKVKQYEFDYLKRVRWSYTYFINKTYQEDSAIFIPSLGIGANYKPYFDLFLIPASVMQLPLYYDDNTASSNYGALGSVIGHELGHAIWLLRDYDWIPVEDEAAVSHWNNEVDCIKDQYTKYKVNGQQLDGTKTWNENIADNSGVKASFYAYLDYSKNAKVNYTLPGVNYNHRQQFFISYAQMWCGRYTDDQLKKALQTDPHSVSKYRVNGPLSNLKEFSKEFNCPVGSTMNPEHKCTLL